jgi:N-acetylglucosaminyldiphosphoundecaprenol N-acetyl-beta-D-mannosaminyltransferase
MQEAKLTTRRTTGESARLKRTTFDMLGVNVDSISMDAAIHNIEHWIGERGKTRIVSFTNVHAVMEAYRRTEFNRILNETDMVCPDGMPLVWMNRLRGGNTEHVCGPDLMLEFIRRTSEKGYSHFFYGSRPDVVAHLAEQLRMQFPKLNIAGWYSPPFRSLTEEEDCKEVEMINSLAPDLIWVGLGCPKQERWQFEHRYRLKASVVLAVGQAFDILANTLPAAPRWMRECGMEWFFRLCQEPKRLWQRYLQNNSAFLYALLTSSLGIRGRGRGR